MTEESTPSKPKWGQGMRLRRPGKGARAVSRVENTVNKTFRRSEVKDALPLVKQNPIEELMKWTKDRAEARKADKVHKPSVSFFALLKYSTGTERLYMILGLILAGISGLALPAWLVLLAKSLDTFSNLANLINAGLDVQDVLSQELLKLVVAFAIIGGIALVCGTIYVFLWTYTGEKQSLRIKERFVRSAFYQDAEWFDLNNREEVPTIIANAMIHLSGAIGRQMADLFANAWSSAGCLAVALVLNAPLALVMLAIVPVALVAVSIVGCFLRKSSREGAESFASAGALATEAIAGIKTVASLCAERWTLMKYENDILAAQKSSVYAGFLQSLGSGIVSFLFYSTYTVAFFIGTEQVANDSGWDTIIGCFFSDDPNCRVTGATIMCCIYGVILCATFFGLMAPGLQAVNLGRQAAVLVFDTIERVPSIDVSSDEGETLDDLKGAIEFRDVLFAYPSRPNNPIFYDFKLVIKPGTSVALVGPSGSGKSTIAKLLLRFYDTTKGDVLVDGISLRTLKLSWWRSQVGYVAQDPILFPGSFRYNIACAKPSATDEDVIKAAKAACAHDFIMELPDGYDTYYSGASIQLSGGQMQRICIARAIIRDPSLLILDEATSALDTNSERQVQDALANIRKLKKMTTVTVAHRLSTIVSSDQIAVISGGSIAELGTHKSLLEADGIYAELCASQGITLDSEFDAPEGPSQDSTKDASLVPGREKATEVAGEDENLKQEEPEEEELANLSRLWSLNRPEWGYMVMGIIGACIVGALSPSEAILTANIVVNFYTVEADDMLDANRPWILGFLAMAGAALIGNIMAGCGFSVAGYRLTGRMRALTFEAIIRRSMGWFDFPDHSTGELTTRLEADAEAVAKITGWSLGYRVRVFACLTAGIVIALVFAWQVGLIAIACIPFIMGAAIIQKCCTSRRLALQQDGLSPATILEQGLRGISSVQAYGLAADVCEDYSKALKPETEGKVKEGFIAGLVYGCSQFAIFGSFAILFYVGSKLLVSGKIDFLGFFAAVLAVMFGAIGIAQVNADFNAQQDGLAAAARIFNIVDEPLDDKDPFSEEGERPSTLEGGIMFEACSFSYPSRPDVPIYYPSKGRDGFSISILPKETVAFVGRSGCGKSTALQLLLRFYDATSGGVLLDSRNVEDLNLAWLRGQIGYVGQMPVLFAGTVRDNILLGKQDATEEEVIKAAKAASAHDFIMGLSQGYDTDIGSGGSLLSGGQKQRVAIARAVVSDPDILVLDEATAALDNVSEGIVQAALDDMQKEHPRTTLMVAHRLVTVKNCDKIAVLEGGGVKEVGSHSSLLKEKGLYHELWMKQGAAEDEDEAEDDQ